MLLYFFFLFRASNAASFAAHTHSTRSFLTSNMDGYIKMLLTGLQSHTSNFLDFQLRKKNENFLFSNSKLWQKILSFAMWNEIVIKVSGKELCVRGKFSFLWEFSSNLAQCDWLVTWDFLRYFYQFLRCFLRLKFFFFEWIIHGTVIINRGLATFWFFPSDCHQ